MISWGSCRLDLRSVRSAVTTGSVLDAELRQLVQPCLLSISLCKPEPLFTGVRSCATGTSGQIVYTNARNLLPISGVWRPLSL